MKVIKTKYTYDYLEEIRKKCRDESNDNILNKYYRISQLLNLGCICLMCVLAVVWMELTDITCNGINFMVKKFITEEYLVYLPIVVHFIYLIFSCVYLYFLCVCAGKTCSCIRKHFVKKGKIIEDKLAYTKFFRLSIIYEKLEKIGNFDDVYIVEKGKEIELVSFKDGFIRKIDILFLNEMVNQVCREDCLDFTTLDDEVELILKEKDLTEYIK